MIKLDEQARKQLRFLQKTNKDKRVFIKVTVLLMLDSGCSPELIAISLGIDDSTVFRYQKGWLESDLSTYLATNYLPYSGKLSGEQEALLKTELRQNLYISSQEVVDYAEHAFGASYTCEGMVKLLHRLGFAYKKTKSVPCKADPEKQAEFVEELQKLFDELDGNEVVYFNDAVHPQHNTRPDYGWILQGEDFEMPSNPGRKRVNINGALNAHDVTDVIVREDETINAQSTVQLWEAQKERHPGKTVFNICDNARYYHCEHIKEWQKQNPWCIVIYLPAYSPNLNLIERLWKFFRKKISSYYFYEHYSEFRAAVLDFFKNIGQYKLALESLLTLNFRIVSTS
jgi:transposase